MSGNYAFIIGLYLIFYCSYIFDYWSFSAVHRLFSSCGEQALLSSCGAQAPVTVASLVLKHGL